MQSISTHLGCSLNHSIMTYMDLISHRNMTVAWHAALVGVVNAFLSRHMHAAPMQVSCIAFFHTEHRLPSTCYTQLSTHVLQDTCHLLCSPAPHTRVTTTCVILHCHTHTYMHKLRTYMHTCIRSYCSRLDAWMMIYLHILF
jgi:hypothetical protein